MIWQGDSAGALSPADVCEARAFCCWGSGAPASVASPCAAAVAGISPKRTASKNAGKTGAGEGRIAICPLPAFPLNRYSDELFAKKEDLSGRYIETSAEGFAIALNVSSYTLVAAAKAAEPLLSPGGAIVTLSFLGGDRVIPNYNVAGVAKAALESSVRYLASDLGPQGIRVNAVGPGFTPTPFVAAASEEYRAQALAQMPLGRFPQPEDIAAAVAFLGSDEARAVTGALYMVDSGFTIS